MYKLGTRVRIINSSEDSFYSYSLGAEGIIVDHPFGPKGGYDVRFDKGEYNLEGDSTWYVQPQDMEVVNVS